MNLNWALPLSLVGNFDNSMTIHCAQQVRPMETAAAISNNGLSHLGPPALMPRCEDFNIKAEQEFKTEEDVKIMARLN